MSPEDILADAIGGRLASHRAQTPFVVGICGAQGSGKSTISTALTARFERAIAFSLDDLYLGLAARTKLARAVHPLLATRGVPGTHDPALGLEIFGALDRRESVALPRFDKARDDRVPSQQWAVVPADRELVIFEGWCVGALPQRAEELVEPINCLEAEEDRDGRWRRFINDALAGDYQPLFARIDMLVLLAAPDWETVLDWRIEQERGLRAANPAGAAVMSDDEVARFVSCFERLTRHVLAEMPARADLVLRLNRARECAGVAPPSDEATMTTFKRN